MDAASLDLLKAILVAPDISGLLVVAAYRDHEVDEAHPFRVAIQAMHEAVTYLKTHGEPGPYAERMCSQDMLDTLIGAKQYEDYQERFMRD